MASVSFKNVTWGTGDHFWKGKLSQMAQNDQWLFENTPKIRYNAWNVSKDGGVKITAGIVFIPKQNSRHVIATVNFGSFFSPGCKPVVTIGSNNLSGWANCHYNLIGLAGTSVPDHRGFRIRAIVVDPTPAQNKFTAGIYYHWMAVGY